MAKYMIQASYTAEARKAFQSKPQDRTVPVKAMVERLEGRIESLYFSLGDYDVMLIVDLLDDVSAVAAAIAACAPGHLSAYKTTKLLTNDEMMAAMEKARGLSFQAPAAG